MQNRSLKFVTILTIFLLAVTMLIIGCGKKEKYVAKVGEFTISQSEFKDQFISRHRAQEKAEQQTYRERLDFLNTMIDQKLMLADAYRKGLDKKEEILEAKKTQQERVAVQELLFEREIVDKILTEALIKEYYDFSNEELHARHILVRIDNQEDSTSIEKAKNEADSLYQLLVDGTDFAELAKQASDDVTNAPDGGDLGFFKWGDGRMSEDFHRKVFSMKTGEICQPIKLPFGYHIIELLERRPLQQKPYEEEKKLIKENLRRNKTMDIREAATAYLDTLKEENGLVIYADSLEYVYIKISEPGNPHNISLFTNFSEEERKIVVASWSSGDVTVADMDEKIGGRGSGAFNAAEDLKQVIDAIVIPDMLTQRAQARGVYDDPKALEAGEAAMENMMMREIKKLEVDDKINFDDEALMNYYENHEAKYMTDEQVSIREALVEDEALAKELLEKGKKGDNFKRLAKKYTTRASTQHIDGLLGPFPNKRHGRVGREAFKLQEGEFCKQPVRMGNKFSVFQLEKRYPAEQKPFEEARKEVERDYKVETMRDLEESWLKILHEEIAIEIYEENLRDALPFVKISPPVKHPDIKGDEQKGGALQKESGKSIKMTEPKPLRKDETKKEIDNKKSSDEK